MGKQDWYRKRNWSEADQQDFFAHLKRSRGADKKAQYLRIQAAHLAQTGDKKRLNASLSLLDVLLGQYPEPFELAQAYKQKADVLVQLGGIGKTIDNYRKALQAERDFPNVKTSAWMDFGWLVVERKLADLYKETLSIMKEFSPQSPLAIEVYRFNAVCALIYEAWDNPSHAREFARAGLEAASQKDSGFKHHPSVGLVTDNDIKHPIFKKLKALAVLS